MLSDNTWTVRDWHRTALSGSDLLVHAAMRRGIAGDRESILNLLTFCQSADGQKISPIADHDEPVDMDLRVLHTNGKLKDYKLKNATLVKAVAICLSYDTDSLVDIGESNTHAHVSNVLEERRESQRKLWTEADAQIMHQAIELWRENRPELIEFITNCARHVRHPGFVAAMVDHNLDMPDLMWRSIMAHGTNDDETNRSGVQLMLQASNTQGLALWLESIKDLSAVQGMNVPILKEAFGGTLKTTSNSTFSSYQTDESIKSQLPFTLVEEGRASTARAATDDLGPVTQGLLRILRTLYRDEKALVGHANTLTRYLTGMDANDVPRSQRFVESVLNEPVQGGRSLSVMLDDMATSIDRPLDSKQNLDASVLNLLLKSAATHCADVIKAASNLIASQPAIHCDLLKACAMAGVVSTTQERQRSTLNSTAFQDTIRALQQAGVDLKSSFMDTSKDKPAQSTFLHALAESRHKDTVDALLVCLDEGFDPSVRNGRNWLASSSVTDKDIKASWIAVEKSYAARKAATSAIDEIVSEVMKP